MSTCFLPWVRPAPLTAGLTVRVELRSPSGGAISATTHEVGFAVLGPGDIVGVQAAEIVTRFPGPDTVGAAPNLFPMVELASPDLPWRVGASMTPWIALVVVAARGATVIDGEPAPAIAVDASDLPPWRDVARWVHAQVDGASATPDDSRLRRGVARLLSPRRLDPDTTYLAALVPTFEAGRLAGLGLPVPDVHAATPAWGDVGAVRLPMYAHWRFTTGPAGDFETLVRRLRPRPLVASEPPASVDLTALDDPQPQILWSALVPTAHVDPPPQPNWRARLAALRDEPDARPPRIGLPRYGLGAVASDVAPPWIDELNLDPRWRQAAALGAEVVRRHQDELVGATWKLLGDLPRAAHERELGKLGDVVTRRWTTKHIAALDPATQLLVGTLAVARTRSGAASTATVIDASALPRSLLSTGLRRLAATHARVASGPVAAAVSSAATRRVPMGESPRAVLRLVTAATLRQLVTAAQPELPDDPPRPRPRVPVDRPWSPGARGPLQPVGLVSLRTRWIDEALPTLLARKPGPLRVVRPAPLPLAVVASAVTNQLTRPTGITRAELRADLSPLVTSTSATAPLSAAPYLDLPLAPLLTALDPRFLVASVGVPPDTVGALALHSAFIEAVMIGANHELQREMQWRGAPIDPRHTPLRQFFDKRGRATEAAPDLPALATWPRTAGLGTQLAHRDVTVIVWRGDFVRRFADAVIYAAPAIAIPGGRGPSLVAAQWIWPSFRGLLTDDTMFCGVPLSAATLRGDDGLGWYLVVVERPSGLRFGLDEPGSRDGFETWNDLSWADVALRGAHIDAAGATPTPRQPGALRWGVDGAHMGAITAQRPLRVAFHAAEFLPELP